MFEDTLIEWFQFPSAFLKRTCKLLSLALNTVNKTSLYFGKSEKNVYFEYVRIMFPDVEILILSEVEEFRKYIVYIRSASGASHKRNYP